ncbi:hypothetical protein PR202_ga19596 [Eleusine coracana subsp. coracana]|uniref:Uncharacterized protein n=1 Tax=Eleusine coracana subsp. coracana TaxID=191504 RepID=A0AAV5CUN5_ELECO|nr:hypothetical protein PR202_ga19596 [Eleusine coracana subsp. coracana]
MGPARNGAHEAAAQVRSKFFSRVVKSATAPRDLGRRLPRLVRFAASAFRSRAPSPAERVPARIRKQEEMADAKPQQQQQQAAATAGVWNTVKPFVNGGASGMLATCVIQPIDMVKVRIQLGEGSAGQVTKNMLANEGLRSFYKGLSAGLLRQATYTTARLGSFRVLTNKAVEKNDGKPLPLIQKAFIGLTAGAIGACVGSPADLALIRMQKLIQPYLPHKGSVELFRDKLGAGEISTVIGASAVSGFFASACSLPFDYVKTQIQKMQPDANGKYPYTGSLDCALKTFKSGGPFKFYTGFPVYCVRIAPHVMYTYGANLDADDLDILESDPEV